MDRYQRVAKPKAETPINDNEIRVTTQGIVRNYISYSTTLFQEKCEKQIVLKAMGQAISKTVAISEIIKKRIPGLHQDIAICSLSIIDVWEPIEEGLLPLETTRQVSMISITLSITELNKNSPGYAIHMVEDEDVDAAEDVAAVEVDMDHIYIRGTQMEDIQIGVEAVTVVEAGAIKVAVAMVVVEVVGVDMDVVVDVWKGAVEMHFKAQECDRAKENDAEDILEIVGTTDNDYVNLENDEDDLDDVA
ncbi:hypothetical protein V2J09_003233 [Rumex salicifolius]